jgi:hypothetical protein
MKLHAIEASRLVYLVHVTRPAGQVFLPKAAQALIARYNFQVFPTAEQLTGDVFTFKMGEFEGCAIDEFSIHTDGMIVASKSNTTLLDGFVGSLFEWAAEGLGLERTEVPPHERHYESYLIVSMDIEEFLPKAFSASALLLQKKQEGYGLKPFKFDFGGLSLAVDATLYTGRKPVAFTLARRVNAPFSEKFFYSSAPLKTDDHVALLEKLEKDLG